MLGYKVEYFLSVVAALCGAPLTYRPSSKQHTPQGEVSQFATPLATRFDCVRDEKVRHHDF